jgi:hypothetical protein
MPPLATRTITNTEYKDASLLLFTLMRGATVETPFLSLALGAFGLHYSALPVIEGTLAEHLVRRIRSLQIDAPPVAEEAQALFLAAHVLRQTGRWDALVGEYEEAIIEYCEQLANLRWLRNSLVATLFLLGFESEDRFRELSTKAQQYLEDQLQQGLSSEYPIILFGLSLARDGNIQVQEGTINNWLSRQQKPFAHLCLLTVALHSLGHPLFNQCAQALQGSAFENYVTTVAPNLSTIRVLLAVIHLAHIGQSSEEIETALSSLPLDKETREKVSAIIRADSRLFIEFRDGMLAQSPVVSHLAFYLFAAAKTSLRDAYIISGPLKDDFDEFRKSSDDVSVKVVARPVLAWFLLLFAALASFLLCLYWWPLADKIYDWALTQTPNVLIQSYLDDVLKFFILLPLYVIYGSAMAVWLRGRIILKDLTLGHILSSLREIVSSIVSAVGFYRK